MLKVNWIAKTNIKIMSIRQAIDLVTNSLGFLSAMFTLRLFIIFVCDVYSPPLYCFCLRCLLTASLLFLSAMFTLRLFIVFVCDVYSPPRDCFCLRCLLSAYLLFLSAMFTVRLFIVFVCDVYSPPLYCFCLRCFVSASLLFLSEMFIPRLLIVFVCNVYSQVFEGTITCTSAIFLGFHNKIIHVEKFQLRVVTSIIGEAKWEIRRSIEV